MWSLRPDLLRPSPDLSPSKRHPAWPRRGAGPRGGHLSPPRNRPCPVRTAEIYSRSAPCVVEAHGLANVREQVYELAARGDQRDDHDERDQGENERVFHHSLS